MNGEEIKWLDSLLVALPPRQLKKPDLFITWRPFARVRLGPGEDPPADGIPEGGLASRALQLDGCVNELFEAKHGTGSLTAADFGQLVGFHSRLPGQVRSALFNGREFWLYLSDRTGPLALIKGEWGARGSLAELRDFFIAAPEPPLVPLLRFMACALGAVFIRVAGADEGSGGGGGGGGGDARPALTSSFLGAGGSGRVFAVKREGDDAPSALKVSSVLSKDELEYEFDILQEAEAAGAPVVSAVRGTLTFFHDPAAGGSYRGGGFLLRHVCARATISSEARCIAAFEALRALHEAGFAHGDARLPNLLVHGRGEGAEEGKLAWIDLREPEGVAREALRADARALAGSVLLQRGVGAALDGAVLEAAERVGEGGAAYGALGRAVWAAQRS